MRSDAARNTALLSAGYLLAFCGVCFGQTGPPPPAPIIETELKQNSTKIREIELERIKRDARKPAPDTDEKAREIRFRETKERFEAIQKRQDAVVKAYTHGKNIDYAEISRSAMKIYENALWLDREVFGSEPSEEDSDVGDRDPVDEPVRELIIRLDEAIGNFVKSPVFRGTTVLDRSAYQDAQKKLRAVAILSRKLSLAAAGR